MQAHRDFPQRQIGEHARKVAMCPMGASQTAWTASRSPGWRHLDDELLLCPCHCLKP